MLRIKAAIEEGKRSGCRFVWVCAAAVVIYGFSLTSTLSAKLTLIELRTERRKMCIES